MRYTYFRFENFKGIESEKLVLNKTNSNVFALVGLNESGKTTVLEAINYFVYKTENLKALNLDSYQIGDIHNLIPINKRDNFNGTIVVEAQIELDDSDVEEIIKAFKKNNIVLEKWSKLITYTQKYNFVNSVYNKDKYEFLWDYTFVAKVRDEKIATNLKNDDASIANAVIKERLPSILYFPNFLFEFPEKIYLNSDTEDPKHKYYQLIIQDVLDSMGTGTNIKEHIIDRVNSNDAKDRRNLLSVTGKMQKQLTRIIFEKWNQILNRKIDGTEIVLIVDKDDKGPYIEFNVKDDVDTYRIVERSLGFRWFFVYILLTQFRTFRKQHNNVLFLFDEPASNLHPSAQMELLNSFEKLSTVIYTTHSHYLINPKWLENTFVIKNEAIDYDDEIKYSLKNTNVKISTYRNFAVKHPNQTTYFQPILEVLDYRPSNLELVPKVVITEGKNDYYTLNYFQQILKVKKPLKIVPGTTSSNMESLISLYTGWATDYIILLDSDKEGLAQKKRYLDLYGDVCKERIFTYEDIDPIWIKFEMESLFADDDKLLIQTHYYPNELKYSKKIFNRSLQELYMAGQLLGLSENTKSNFESVIKFLKLKLHIS